MRRAEPMPSPRNTNAANLWLLKVPVAVDPRGMAIDELCNGSSREELLRQAALQKRGDQAQAPGLLAQRGAGASGEQKKGSGMNLDQQKLADFLRSKGLSEDDIRTACDIGLGINKSAKFGGAVTGGNFGGALHDELTEADRKDPAKDRNFMLDAEERGECAFAGDSAGFEARYGQNGMRIGSSPFDPGRAAAPSPEPTPAHDRNRPLAFDRGDRALTDFDRRFPNNIKEGLWR